MNTRSPHCCMPRHFGRLGRVIGAAGQGVQGRELIDRFEPCRFGFSCLTLTPATPIPSHRPPRRLERPMLGFDPVIAISGEESAEMCVHGKASASTPANAGPAAGARLWLLGLLALAATAAAPGVARAVNTCNGLLTIDYVAGPDFALPGDVVRVKLTLGTGSIQGGTKLNVDRLRFDLDCNSGMTLGIPCTDEGMI